MLHTVNKSPFTSRALELCLARARPGSAVLLIEDGVLGALKRASADLTVQAAPGVKLYALLPDLAARGFGPDDLADGVRAVDDAGFVELAARHTPMAAWG